MQTHNGLRRLCAHCDTREVRPPQRKYCSVDCMEKADNERKKRNYQRLLLTETAEDKADRQAQGRKRCSTWRRQGRRAACSHCQSCQTPLPKRRVRYCLDCSRLNRLIRAHERNQRR